MSERLCYVDGSFAFFTTQKLGKQWGDDWNDAPYEHNAGDPYEPTAKDVSADGSPAWTITKVAFDGPLVSPCEGVVNSRYSVEQINSGAVAWLVTSQWSSGPFVAIPAGVSIVRFCELVWQAGGTVYLPVKGGAT